MEWKLMKCDRIEQNRLRRNGMKGTECEGYCCEVHTRTLGAVHVRTRLIAQQQSTVLSAGVYGAERVAALAVAAVVGEGVAPAERTGHGRGSLAEHGV